MRHAIPHRRGAAFVTTLWVIVVLAALALVLSHSISVESIASANRLSQAQADNAERGAEQFLLAAVDAEVATPGSVVALSPDSTTGVPMQDLRIGDAHVWILTPDPDYEQNHEQNYCYGLTDEAGKIDLNSATLDMLELLPGMTDDIAASIYNWRGTATATNGQGASDADYTQLPDPYTEKHAPFETVDELLLVKDVTPDILFNQDRNRNGVIDPAELQSGSSSITLSFSSDGSNRGIFPCVTVYGSLAGGAAAAGGGQGGGAGSTVVDVNGPNPTALRNLLQQLLPSRAEAILSLADVNRPFRNIFDFAVKTQMTSSELSAVFSRLSATGPGPTIAKLNVNTASRAAILCLPGLQDSDASAILAYRQTNTATDPTDISWLLDQVDKQRLAAVGGLVTGRSTCYSGDIVAVSADGRAFKRVRIVIDGRTAPSKIVYRRDLTSYGWPLPADIRSTLRTSGNTPGSNGNSAKGST